MLAYRFIVVLLLTLSACLPGVAQVTGTTPRVAPSQRSARASSLRIVSPKTAQKIRTNFVDVQYEITNPAASMNDLPVFRLQLDGDSPVTTSSTDHTFTGLTPGKHSVTVELVDANGTPVQGTRATVHFVVLPSESGAGPGASIRRGSTQSDAVAFNDVETEDEGVSTASDEEFRGLHPSNNALPLLSVVGFGVLVGGLVSALRTR